jgi:ABC-type Fe3+/spermidine/putrescine transport system ATPase subunit
VHLEALKTRYPAELSGGQQQRVALARAFVVEPQILLLDEPLSNLDANLREEMRFEIRRLHEEFGITTIYVTHDQAEAMVTSDRIVVLNKGRMVQVGTERNIRSTASGSWRSLSAKQMFIDRPKDESVSSGISDAISSIPLQARCI